MRIGIFDSGLGGLIIAKAIRKVMPQYDYVYLGDTKRVPYGNRSHNAVYEFTREAVDYLFKKENCAIVIVACNTASAVALRKLQRKYSNRKILGVLIPAAEEAAKYERVGVLATAGTVSSNSFLAEINKINKQTKIFQNAAPMLVPLAEEGERTLSAPFIKKYLAPLLTKKPQAIVLGCTHYPFFKKEFKTKIISQDEVVPKKLKEYFKRHPEIEKKLSRQKTTRILVTDLTLNIEKLSQKWFSKEAKPKLVNL